MVDYLVDYAIVGLSVFYCVAYGPLQTLASVGLSVFHCFCLCHMVHYRFLPSVGLAQARPNYSLATCFILPQR